MPAAAPVLEDILTEFSDAMRRAWLSGFMRLWRAGIEPAEAVHQLAAAASAVAGESIGAVSNPYRDALIQHAVKELYWAACNAYAERPAT